MIHLTERALEELKKILKDKEERTIRVFTAGYS